MLALSILLVILCIFIIGILGIIGLLKKAEKEILKEEESTRIDANDLEA